MTISPGDRPLTRRELRERERRLTADATAGATLPEQRSPSSSAGGDGSGGPASSASSPPKMSGKAASSSARPDDDLAPHDPHRYTWKHYLALAAVAAVLGYLVWSLATTAHEPGAASAVRTDPITSLPAHPAALRGEL